MAKKKKTTRKKKLKPAFSPKPKRIRRGKRMLLASEEISPSPYPDSPPP